MPRPANPKLPGLLLDAALALLDERQGTDFSMRELAGRVDYAVTAVYRCYETRDDLLKHLALRLLAELYGVLQAAVGDQRASLPEQLTQMGEAYLRWATAHPARYRFVFSGEARDLDEVELRRARAGLEWVVQHLDRRGVGRDAAEREALATLLMAALHGIAELALSGRLRGMEAADPVAYFRRHAPGWLGAAFAAGRRPS